MESDYVVTLPQKNGTTGLSYIEETYSQEELVRKNEEIVREADDLILERIRNRDGSLRLSEVIQGKSEAFKQIRAIQGKDDGEQQLIPSQINIQIINN